MLWREILDFWNCISVKKKQWEKINFNLLKKKKVISRFGINWYFTMNEISWMKFPILYYNHLLTWNCALYLMMKFEDNSRHFSLFWPFFFCTLNDSLIRGKCSHQMKWAAAQSKIKVTGVQTCFGAVDIIKTCIWYNQVHHSQVQVKMWLHTHRK